MSNNPMDAHISQTSVINISRLFESDAPADFQLDEKIVDALRHIKVVLFALVTQGGRGLSNGRDVLQNSLACPMR